MRYAIFWLFYLLLPMGLSAQESTASKNVHTFTLYAPELQTTKTIQLYLPPGYGTSKQKYPVIYMPDGQNLFDTATAFSQEWKIDETLDSLKTKVIVVGIVGDNDQRFYDLSPYPNAKHGDGNGDNYIRFITQTLKPYIDTHYTTKTNPRNTLIIGSSLGGLLAYHAVLQYPDVFGKAGVFSPSFSYSETPYTLTEKAKDIKAKIYFLAGDAESDTMVEDIKKMERLLDRSRCYCLMLTKTKIVKNGQHYEKLWREGFAEALHWLL